MKENISLLILIDKEIQKIKIIVNNTQNQFNENQLRIRKNQIGFIIDKYLKLTKETRLLQERIKSLFEIKEEKDSNLSLFLFIFFEKIKK